MAFMECRFNSAVLLKAVSMNVIVPLTGNTDEPRKVMYLLHGLSDDSSMWFRRSSIERYADRYNMVVIMPDGGRSFYTDAVSGENYWTFISEELPQTVKSIFNLSPDKEHTFAAGLSMGGYGALKLGLRCPEKFAAVAGLSSVTDIKYRFRDKSSAGWHPEFRRIFGTVSQVVPRGNDLFDLAQKAVDSGKELPEIISFCGSEDFMIGDNRKFNKFMRKLEYPGFYAFERPGSHTWEFWDLYIQDVMKFFVTGELPEQQI
ncbi:MAG: esterase family protein [Lentisphaerae bacterium]|nr:esterase family protein [Lentisphaerota bacterium]